MADKQLSYTAARIDELLALAGTALQEHQSLSGYATEAFVSAAVSAAIADLVNASPAALDTLKELADALGGDANFSATVTSALAAKQPSAIADPDNDFTADTVEGALHELAAKADPPAVVTAYAATVGLADNTEYVWTGVTGSLTLVVPAAGECLIRMTTDAVSAPTVTFSGAVGYIGPAPTFGTAETWEISVRDGVYIAAKVSV